jgi:hypothetical protein
MRQTIFISHAAPEDNDFTRWLSLQLIGLGYKIWSDVIKLKGGEDWWPVIESELRDNCIKFLLVLSKDSNHKDGVLKELAVAQKVKKILNDPQFITPLHIDQRLSYDDVNIELSRLNSINFKKSWASGLKSLLDFLEEHNVVKSNNNYDEVRSLWQTVYLHNRQPLQKSETYLSNWFPIVDLPKVLRFHKFKYAIPYGFDLNSLPFPVVVFKDFVGTFAWSYDFLSELPRTDTYDQSKTIEISTEDILNGKYGGSFIQNKEAKNIVVQLLNKGFDRSLQKKSVSIYLMSNKTSFWIKKDVLEKDKFNKILLVGKQKEKQWHFGISGSAKMFPERAFLINSHIWFTSDGTNLIPESSKQHSARRKQGKNWWNNDWRSKTVAFMQFLAEQDEKIVLDLGSEEYARISTSPIMFTSSVSYVDPNIGNLPEDDHSYAQDDEEDNELSTNDSTE